MHAQLKHTLIALVLSVGCVGAAFAYQFDFGALKTEQFYQDEVSFGLPRNFNLARSPLHIPKQYGRLMTITASSRYATLWFESADGVIRNINVDANTPLLISRQGELVAP